MNHEEELVRAFVRPDKQARWAQFLSNPKRRQKILNELNHNFPFVSALGTEVRPNEGRNSAVERLLKLKGAGPTCHVIGDCLTIDGHEVPLSMALDEISASSFGAILSLIPGRLAYYKPESPSKGIILECKPD